MNKKQNALTRKIKNNRGFSFMELIVAVLILSFVSLCMAYSVDFAVDQYNRSMIRSERDVLCSTLSDVIRSELANTRVIRLGSRRSGTVYTLDGFFSRTYATSDDLSHFYAVNVDESHNIYESAGGFGELLLGAEKNGKIVGNLLLSAASYSNYHLKAKVDVTYDTAANIFHVELTVRDSYEGNGGDLVERFDVLPLNDLTQET